MENYIKVVEEQAKAIGVLCDACHNASRNSGWYNDLHTGEPIARNVPEMIALCHAELSEALEGYRKNKYDDHIHHLPSITVELADLLIRVFDLAGYLKLDLSNAVAAKFAYNATRDDHKIENRIKKDGKKF